MKKIFTLFAAALTALSMSAASAGKKSSVRLPTSSAAPPRRRRRAKASLAYTITPSESFTKTAVCSMSSMIFPFL